MAKKWAHCQVAPHHFQLKGLQFRNMNFIFRYSEYTYALSFVLRCCTKTISNPTATLTATLDSPHALTSITIWNQEEEPLILSENQLEEIQISFGSTESLTGCEITADPKYWMSPPAGYIRRGLLCGNAGTFFAISLAKLDLEVASTCKFTSTEHFEHFVVK